MKLACQDWHQMDEYAEVMLKSFVVLQTSTIPAHALLVAAHHHTSKHSLADAIPGNNPNPETTQQAKSPFAITCNWCPAAAVQGCKEGTLGDHGHAGVFVVELCQELG